mgnify:CR=1 FL=1
MVKFHMKYRKVIDAALHISVLLKEEAETQDGSFSWWQMGKVMVSLEHNDGADLSISFNVDEIPEASIYYNLYGYCALHSIKFEEHGNG